MSFHIDKGTILKHELTTEGYLNCYARIAKVGKLRYTNPDGSVRIENVSKEVLFDKASTKSFKTKPVTLLHPPVKVNSTNSRLYQRGLTTPYTVIDGDFLGIIMSVTDQETIDTILRGDACEISCGYDAKTTLREDGEYDQTSRFGNHIAIVPRGRAGSEVAIKLDSEDSELWVSDELEEIDTLEVPKKVLDKFEIEKCHKDIKNTNMKKFLLNGITFQTEDSDLVEQVKIVNSRIDSLEKISRDYETSVSENVTLTSTVAELTKDKESLEGRCDGAVEEIKTLKVKLEEIAAKPEVKNDAAEISAEVKARLDMWQKVSPYFGSKSEFKVDTSYSEIDIQKYALKLRTPELNLEGKSAEYVEGRFDAMSWSEAESNPKSGAKVDEILEVISEGRKDSTEKSPLQDSLKAYMDHLESAWQS